MSVKGHCLCSAVTITVADAVTEVHCCHCSMCRRWNGGPALAVPVGNLAFESDGQIVQYQSSDWAERGFCGRCGSNLFYRLKESDTYYLMMGSFDDQKDFQLASEIYVDHKPSAYSLAGDHPRLTEEEFLEAFQST